MGQGVSCTHRYLQEALKWCQALWQRSTAVGCCAHAMVNACPPGMRRAVAMFERYVAERDLVAEVRSLVLLTLLTLATRSLVCVCCIPVMVQASAGWMTFVRLSLAACTFACVRLHALPKQA